MRILVAAATALEVAPFVSALSGAMPRGPRLSAYTRGGHQIDLLVTGVGMVAMAAWCSRTLANGRYDLALNFGVCGAFDRALAPGEVVHVVSDRIAELGAEDGDQFLTIQELGLTGEDQSLPPGEEMVNATPPMNSALRGLPAVRGITVNTVHGRTASIAEVTARFKPDVESMEGAAFMYACLIHEIRFAQVRAISNSVEPRNRAAWKLAEAVDRLGAAALDIVGHA
jgi:futalosine hydrolase